MTIVIRSNACNGYIGQSEWPFINWSWKQLNQVIHSPKIFEIENELFVTGRGSVGGNVIYHINQNLQLELVYTLPGGGDTGYPGTILTNNQLWISYYTTYQSFTAIYLAKMSKEMLLTEIRSVGPVL